MSKATGKAATPKRVMDLARKPGARMVEVKLVDTFGAWQRSSRLVAELTEELFSESPQAKRLASRVRTHSDNLFL